MAKLNNSCYIFCFYIKPQLPVLLYSQRLRCYIFCFYIKPQRFNRNHVRVFRCYIFCFYIKPQLRRSRGFFCCVATFFVSTSNRNVVQLKDDSRQVATFFVSTSNRNAILIPTFTAWVATFFVSTSNRNLGIVSVIRPVLLHFLFLHQTATYIRDIYF